MDGSLIKAGCILGTSQSSNVYDSSATGLSLVLREQWNHELNKSAICSSMEKIPAMYLKAVKAVEVTGGSLS
jgi:hypothetical protein